MNGPLRDIIDWLARLFVKFPQFTGKLTLHVHKGKVGKVGVETTVTLKDELTKAPE